MKRMMSSWGRVAVIAVAAFAACKFAPGETTDGSIVGPHDAAIHDGDMIDGPVDARSIDAPPPECSGTYTQCAGSADDMLEVCAGIGSATFQSCAWGCLGSGSGSGFGSDAAPHCGELVPSGGAVLPTDLDGSGLMMIELGSGVQIDGNSGAIYNSDATVVRNIGSGVDHGIDYHLVNGVAVFRFAALQIDGPLTFYQELGAPDPAIPPVALVSAGAIDVRGVINAQGGCTSAGAGPGGGAGGAVNANGGGSGGGSGGSGASQVAPGGGGGGYGTAGATGGSANVANTAGGVMFGSDPIPVLIGGGGGGGGGNGTTSTAVLTQPRGGNGGGSLQLVAETTLTIEAAGGVNASGCGGQSGIEDKTGMVFTGGAGGGAGGSILLEAHDVTVAGALAVNGGGGGVGGGSNASMAGANGSLSRMTAGGGQMGFGAGGNGAAGAAGPTAGSTNTDSGVAFGGGGGGAIGRIRFDTRTGAVTSTGATLSPDFGDSGTTCKKAAAQVQ